MHPNFDKLLPSAEHPATRRATFLAETVQFSQVGRAGNLFWGKLKTAHSQHVNCVLDLNRPALFCSCSARRLPCLHVLAFAFYIKNQLFISEIDLPDWALALVDGISLSNFSIKPQKTDAERANDKKQRLLQRLVAAEAGFAELDVWLADTIQHGLADSLGDDSSFFEKMAARLADASMSGISREMRLLAKQVRHGTSNDEPWQLLAAEKLGEWHLLSQIFKQRNQLTDNQLSDILSKIGISIKKEEVLADGLKIDDTWIVLHQKVEPFEDALLVRRVWLWGVQSHQIALLLDFKHPASGQDFPLVLSVGSVARGVLHFYPSAVPLRALNMEDLSLTTSTFSHLVGGFETVDAFLQDLAEKLGQHPFLINPLGTGFPTVFSGTTLHLIDNQLFLIDFQQKMLPVQAENLDAWKMLAFGGGYPLDVFGWWNGRFFKILVLMDGKRWLHF